MERDRGYPGVRDTTKHQHMLPNDREREEEKHHSGALEASLKPTLSEWCNSDVVNSLKLKLLNSNEELDSPDSPSVANVPSAKEKTKIREKLRRFFMRRPNVEELMRRGIIKNEPVFGTTLTILTRAENSEIPLFVKKCISVIESKTEYPNTERVYRQSGNLSVVQKIRLQIDWRS